MKIDKHDADLLTLVLVKEWVQDLVAIGMSYTRISTRLKLSPSTIQKIIKKNRVPRVKTQLVIGKYYLKIFEAPEIYGTKALDYYLYNEVRIINTIARTKSFLQDLAQKS